MIISVRASNSILSRKNRGTSKKLERHFDFDKKKVFLLSVQNKFPLCMFVMPLPMR